MAKSLASFLIWLLLTPAIPGSVPEDRDEYDLVIVNARIIDGTGNPWFRGSIAVKDGRIAKVGFFDTSNSKQLIDAKNQMVAPGFIDVHTHVEDIYENPKAENFIRMGVTSLITGNCGGSALDIAK